jgi:hypothetical protein
LRDNKGELNWRKRKRFEEIQKEREEQKRILMERKVKIRNGNK